MNIGKIIKITDEKVFIGYEDRSLKEISVELFEFEPSIGDYVEVYGDIVIKVDKINNFKNYIKSFKDKELSSKVNIICGIALLINAVICSFAFYKTSFLGMLCALVLLESILMILLNIVFIIVSALHNKEVMKKNAAKYLIISVLVFMVSFFLDITVFGDNIFGSPNSKTPISNSTKSTTTNKSSSTTTTSKVESSKSSTTSSSPTTSSSSTTTSPSTKPKTTVDSDKSNYSEVDYDKWNHDEVPVNTKVKVYGKVLQAMESGKSYTLRVAINDEYDKIILVSIPSSYNNRVIAEDDHITLYGVAQGRQSYETVFKATKTLPYMIAYMYDN